MKASGDLPVEGVEVSVHGDVLYDPVGKGDLADVDEGVAADGKLNALILKLLVKESEKAIM